MTFEVLVRHHCVRDQFYVIIASEINFRHCHRILLKINTKNEPCMFRIFAVVEYSLGVKLLAIYYLTVLKSGCSVRCVKSKVVLS